MPDNLNEIETGDESSWFLPDRLATTYGPAILRYLLALCRGDEAAADEIYSDMMTKVIGGQFSSWQPRTHHDRFRDYLKGGVFKAFIDHKRRLPPGRRVATFTLDKAEQVEDEDARLDEVAAPVWLEGFKTALYRQALRAMKDRQGRRGGVLYYNLLSELGAKGDGCTAKELCRRIEEQEGRSVTPATIRVQLHRAREMFAEYLVDEVQRTLPEPTLDAIQEELGHLGWGFLASLLPNGWREWPTWQSPER